MNESNAQLPRRPGSSPVSWVIVALWSLLIVAILAAMLMPAGGGARDKAERAKCLSNLKQLGAAIAMYAESYSGRCPVDSASNPTLLGSIRLLSNTLTSASILHCPDDRRRGVHAETDFKKLTAKNISYSYVPNLIWDEAATNSIVAMDRIDSPSPGRLWPANGNHGANGGNVLFMDGHVEWQVTLPSGLKGTDGKEIVLSP